MVKGSEQGSLWYSMRGGGKKKKKKKKGFIKLFDLRKKSKKIR